MIFKSIRHNLGSLWRLSGRDSRALFWPYAIAVFLAGMVANLLIMIPVFYRMMAAIVEYIQTHPEGLPEPEPGALPLPPELMPDFGALGLPMTLVSLATLLLLWSAAVRRLHDRDRSGWWGAIVLPSHLLGLAVAPQAMEAMSSFSDQSSPIYILSTVNSLVFWAGAIILILFLVGEGSAGPNRFGDPPAA